MKTSRFFAIIIPLLLFLFIPFYAVQLISLTVIGIISSAYLYAFHVRSHVKVTRAWTRSVAYRFQSISMQLCLENTGFLPVISLSLIDSCGELFSAHSERFIVQLKPKQRKTLTYNLKGYRRGEYTLGPVRMQAADPLGLFPWEERVPASGKVIIYPRVYPIRLRHRSGLPYGNLYADNRIYEDVTRYRSLRDYMPGDNPRRINWKASARLGKLFSMEYLPTMYYSVLLLLDLNSGDYSFRHRYRIMERAIETAASISLAAVEAGQDVALLSNGKISDEDRYIYLPSGNTINHGTMILETLARISPWATSVQCVPDLLKEFPLSFGTRIMYIGPPLADEQLEFLATIRTGNRTIELYYLGWGLEERHQEELFAFYTRFIPEYGDITL